MNSESGIVLATCYFITAPLTPEHHLLFVLSHRLCVRLVLRGGSVLRETVGRSWAEFSIWSRYPLVSAVKRRWSLQATQFVPVIDWEEILAKLHSVVGTFDSDVL